MRRGIIRHLVMPSTRRRPLHLPDKSAQLRVLRWASDVLGVADSGMTAKMAGATMAGQEQRGLPDLIDAAQPDTRSERILVIAYWLESSTGGGDWTSQSVNDEMKNLGDAVPNITDALSSLMERKPALVRPGQEDGTRSASPQEIRPDRPWPRPVPRRCRVRARTIRASRSTCEGDDDE